MTGRARHARRLGGLVAAGLLCAAAPASAPGAPAPEQQRPTARASQDPALELSAEERRLIQLVSDYRRSRGLSGLRVYPTLMTEARWYAADMAFNDAFSVTHIDSLGRTIDQRFWDFGYPIARPLGQATASGGTTAEETFEQLRTSRLHDEIMRDPRFRLVGAGFDTNPRTDSKAFWVVSFAKYDPAQVKARSSAARAKAAKAKAKKRAGAKQPGAKRSARRG